MCLVSEGGGYCYCYYHLHRPSPTEPFSTRPGLHGERSAGITGCRGVREASICIIFAGEFLLRLPTPRTDHHGTFSTPDFMPLLDGSYSITINGVLDSGHTGCRLSVFAFRGCSGHHSVYIRLFLLGLFRTWGLYGAGWNGIRDNKRHTPSASGIGRSWYAGLPLSKERYAG